MQLLKRPIADTNPLIRKLARADSLTLQDVQLLESIIGDVIEVERGTDVVREGQQEPASNLLLEGMTYRYKIMSDGRRQIFSFQVPGDLFDAQSFVLPRMDHSVAALTRCRIGSINHASMVRITEAHPRLARALWRETLIDAATYREWMASIGRRSAYQRIAHLMCELYTRLDVVGLAHGSEISWPITQAEVGDALGLSVVHVNRTLQELRSSGLITLQAGSLVIHDWDALREAGDFDAGYLHLDDGPSVARAPDLARH